MKNLLNLGKALNKAEQKLINGGGRIVACNSDFGCVCNCFWLEGQCVMELKFTKPCD